jgi:hypothetical protein
MNDLTWSRSRCFKDPVSLHVDTWVIISIVLACFTTSYEGDYVDETTQIIWPLALVGMPVWIAFIVCHSQYMGWIILGHSCWSHSPAVRFPSGLASWGPIFFRRQQAWRELHDAKVRQAARRVLQPIGTWSQGVEMGDFGSVLFILIHFLHFLLQIYGQTYLGCFGSNPKTNHEGLQSNMKTMRPTALGI